MATEIVRVLRVDTKNSAKSIKDLKNEIRGLSKELDECVIGTKEWEEALAKLTRSQREYRSIQEQVRDMSKTGQQDLVKFASFARNLAKSYSALNAAVGLFANGNEDVQKAMLKVQRTIQLIQGLDGVVGLIRDIPKVAAGFRSWLDSLRPAADAAISIQKGINGVDPKKLADLAAANRAAAEAAKAPKTTTTAAAGGGQQYLPVNNEAVKEAVTTYYPALLKQERDLYKEREKAKLLLDENSAKIAEAAEKAKGLDQLFIDLSTAATKAAGLSSNAIPMVGSTKELKDLLNDLQKAPDFSKRFREELEKLGYTANEGLQKISGLLSAEYNNRKQLSEEQKELQKTYDTLSKQYDEITAEIAKTEAGMTGFQKVLARTGVIGKTAFTMIKTALASIGIGLLISGIVALWNWMSKVVDKAKEWQKIQKEINQSTNSIGAKQVVVLKELAIAYGKLGDNAAAKEKFLETYNNKIKETGIAINDVKTAEDVFVNNTSKYVDAIMKRAKAQATEQQAIKIYQEYLDKAYDLEKKYENDRNKQAGTTSRESYIDLLVASGSTLEDAEKAWDTAMSNNQSKIQKDLDNLKKTVDSRLRKMFEDVAQLEKEYGGVFASVITTTTGGGAETVRETSEEVKQLIEIYENALSVLNENKDNEYDEIVRRYAEQIELAKKYGQDTTLLEQAREKELADLQKRWDDEALAETERRVNEEYEILQTQIERIRRMNDTSNLREPREQRYQTVYQQPITTTALGIGASWKNVYQSKEDVDNQYKAQTEYNNKVYELTKSRIEQENALLNEQLQIEGLSADKRWEIERTLSENEIALSDAKLENEQANLNAYLEMQEKRRQALNGVLDVTSTVSGALASIARTEAQNAEEGSERQKRAMKAYKAFAVTQAIADTYKGANEAYAAMASIPYVGPGLGIAAAAAAIIGGIANVKSILSESMSAKSGYSTSSMQSASVTPPSLTTPPIEYTRTLMGDKELDEINKPFKCYVLESDIRSVSNRVTVTENNASF